MGAWIVIYSVWKPNELKRGIVTKSNGNNNGNGHQPLEGLSEQAYEIAKRRQAAAIEAVTMLEDQFEAAFARHAGSVLHTAAWLAGNSLRRSFDADGDGAQGSAHGTAQSNVELKLLKVFMFLVDKYGIKLKPNDYATQIPPEQRPRLSADAIEQQFGNRYDEIMENHGFDLADGARTGAVVCARLVKLHCANRNDLEPQVAASIVSMGFMEGGKGDGL